MPVDVGIPWRYRDGFLRLRTVEAGAGRIPFLEYRHGQDGPAVRPLLVGPDDALPGGELAGAAVLKWTLRADLTPYERYLAAAFLALSRRERVPR